MSLEGGTTVVPASYSSTSTILNVDTISMANQPQGDYYGWVESGMVLRGQTSGAQAKIVNHRLVADYASSALGSFFIPDPNNAMNPKWTSGVQTFTLTDNIDNNQGEAQTLGEQNYESSGTIETVQEQIISVRNANYNTIELYEDRAARQYVGTDVNTVLVSESSGTSSDIVDQWWEDDGDPLAQSFSVEEPTGVFVTSCDVYFETVSEENLPAIFELRTMNAGVPTTKILPFSQVFKDPDEITTSADGSVATKFTFKAPVYLEGGTEYAVVMRSQSNKYKVFISRVGENDLISDEFVTQQPFMGSLFKSQNGSTWDPSQWEDLKFKLNRAKFESTGSLQVYSPILSEGNKQIPTLMPDSINLQSRKIRVGLGTTLAGNTQLHEGVTVSQTGSNATGNLVGFAGSLALASMNVINAGYGYTAGTVTGVGLTNITGNGSGMQATVVVAADGTIDSATVTGVGVGYQVGDVLAFKPSNNGPGIAAKLSVVSNTLIIF